MRQLSVRRMLAELSLGELFEWYRHFIDMYAHPEQPVIAAKSPVACTSVDEEIAMMRAMMGG